MSTLARLLMLVFVLVGYSRPARAAESAKTVATLAGDASIMPEYVCIATSHVTPKEQPRARGTAELQKSNLLRVERGAATVPHDARTLIDDEIGGLQGTKPKDDEAGIYFATLALFQALRAMAAEADSGPCVPTFAVAEPAERAANTVPGMLMCVANDGVAKRGTVAILELTLGPQAANASLSSIALLGSQLTVEVLADQEVQATTFSWRVVGGSYSPSRQLVSAVGPKSRLEIGLVPRCEERVIRLGGVSGMRAGVAGIVVDGAKFERERVGDAVAVLLPNASGNHSLQIHIERQSYVAAWKDRVPDEIAASALRFPLNWKRNCAFPADLRCPALAPVGGGVCKDVSWLTGAPDGICAYDCDVSASRPDGVRFPLRLEFDALDGGLGSWTDEADQPGARLSKYLPVDARSIGVEWLGWGGDPDVSQPFEFNWHRHDVFVAEMPDLDRNVRQAFIRAPFDCEDVISFRAFGNQFYYPGAARFVAGRLAVGVPKLHTLRWGLFVGGGVDVRSLAGFEEGPAARELTMIEPILSLRPSRWLQLDIRVAVVLTRSQRLGSRQEFFETRYVLSELALVRPSRQYYVGFGAGVGLAHAVDDIAMNGGARFVGQGTVVGGVYPWTNLDIALEASMRPGATDVPVVDSTSTGDSRYFPTIWFGAGIRVGRL